jgi:hypothetical protein
MKYLVIAFIAATVTGQAYAGCPEGFTFNSTLKKCEAVPTCPAGFALHPVQDLCVMKSPEGKCGAGNNYNAEEKTCETRILCPVGSEFMSDIAKCIRKEAS